MMIFRLVTSAKVKLHPPSFIIRSVINQDMTHLIFEREVGKLRGGDLCKLGGGMWLRGANQLVLWVFPRMKI